MRVVLYDDETFEPITILDMYHWHQFQLPEGTPIRVPVPREVSTKPPEDPLSYADIGIDIVTVRFERWIRRKSGPTWVAVTNDTESAMLLKSAFLPGQRASLREKEREAFARGFVEALRAALG